MKIKNLIGVGVVLWLGSAAQAALLIVVNPGFEDLYFGDLPAIYGGDVPPTAFPTGPAPNGWSAYGAVGNTEDGTASIGVLNPGTLIDDGADHFPEGAPEGDNVALLFYDNSAGGPEFGIEQTLTDVLEPNTIYTLSVAVGNIASGTSMVEPYQSRGFFDLRGFPGYRIDLMAGETVLVQDIDGLSPGEGEFENSVIQFTTGATHPQMGENLRIRLVSLNNQDIVDAGIDLEVDFDDVQLDATLVPEPGTGLIWILAGAMGCAAGRGNKSSWYTHRVCVCRVGITKTPKVSPPRANGTPLT